MSIYESDLPGVGKKFEIELGDSKRLIIVTHNTGKREVYLRPSEEADSEKLFELSDQLARKVGTILEGAYFQPIQSERVETMLSDETMLEWYNVEENAALVGQTIANARVRERTGVSIIAIQRGDDVIPAPDPATTIEADDTLVIIGSQDDIRDFDSIVTSDTADQT